MKSEEFIGKMIEIPMGKGHARTYAPSILYHSLRSRTLTPNGSIKGYPLSTKEIELADMWREPSPDGYVWLSPQPYSSDALAINAGALNPEDLRYTGQSEGFLLHKGSIPAEAILKKHELS